MTASGILIPHEHHLRVQRTARYFTLGDADAPAAVWFVLHGYGQLAVEFVKLFADLAADNRLVVAPEALNRFYTVSVNSGPASARPVGATWMTREDRDSDIEDYVEYLDALHDELVAKDVPVYVLGFSQGTATAARWVEYGRVKPAGLILWGGFVPPEIHLDRSNNLRRVPLTLVVGKRDHYATAELVDVERARLDAAKIRHRFLEFDGGHVISRRVFPQLTTT